MSKLSNRLREIVSYVPKKAMIASAVVAAAFVPFMVDAYGPERSTYTIEQPADHITFNSITNNPNIGDERNFVGARDASTGDNGLDNIWEGDQITVQDGHEYYVRMYVHNNAASNLNLVAENVTAKFNVPTTTAKKVEVSGILSSSNATPNEYWDSVSFVSNDAFNLVYVAGSAKWENNGVGKKDGVALSDSVVTNSGVKLGYSALDGKIPGCFEYAGYLTFKVKPQFQHTANIGIAKSVAKHNDIADPTDKLEQTKWQQSIEAKPGEVVDYVIDYRNAGNTNQLGVVINDMLPEGMEYVPGSTKYVIYRSTGEVYREGNWGGADTITQNGINASEANSGFAPTKNAHSYVVMFSAKVKESAKPTKCGTKNTLKNVAKVSATVDGERFSNTDDADVVVPADECKPEAVYTCDKLNVNKIERTKYEFTTNYTIKNATFVKVVYNIDGKIYDVTNKDTKYIAENLKAGKHTVISYIVVKTDDGEKKTNECKAEFTVEQAPTAECKALKTNVNKIEKNDEVEFTIVPAMTGKNVKVVSTWIDFGDGAKTDPALVEKYTHKYGKVGEYTIKAYINFEVEGKDKKNVTSANCEAKVTVEKTPEPTPEPEPTPDPTPDPEPKEIEVCDTTDNTIKKIKEDEFDSKKHSMNYDDCKETPKPKEIEVCDITDKTIKKIKETEFDKDKHSKNFDSCKETPVTPVTPSNSVTPVTPVTASTPSKLPEAGAELLGLVGLGGLTTSAGYYISSRRKLRDM